MRARAAADVPAAAPTPQLAPGPARYPNVGGALAAGGGQRVGALLISPYTPSGRVDTTPANAFTLLRTLEQIFGVDPLGYAADEAVSPLPDKLFSVDAVSGSTSARALTCACAPRPKRVSPFLSDQSAGRLRPDEQHPQQRSSRAARPDA